MIYFMGINLSIAAHKIGCLSLFLPLMTIKEMINGTLKKARRAHALNSKNRITTNLTRFSPWSIDSQSHPGA